MVSRRIVQRRRRHARSLCDWSSDVCSPDLKRAPSTPPMPTALDTVRIIAGIGGVEVAHFTVWHDKAGNAPAVTVPGLIFPDLGSFNGDELRQLNLIMPEPCKFISADLPFCSVIRPGTTEHSGALAAATALTNSGLFTGQSAGFFNTLHGLAVAADNALRGKGGD